MIQTDILFTGYYGQKNTGDDAFVEIAEWGAKKYWNKNNNRFLTIEKNLPDTLAPVRGYPITVPRSYRLQNYLLISNTRYLISAGGSTLHSYISKYNAKQIAARRKKNGGRIKLGAIGVSIGPFKSIKDENSIVDYLKQLDFLAVRDQASYDYVKTLSLPYSPINAFDLAGLLPEAYGKRKKLNSENKIIGISVCPYESVTNGDIKKEEKRNRMLIDLIKNLDKKENVKFRFLIINGNERNGDLALTKKTIEKIKPLNYEIIDYKSRTKDMWNSITECDFIISTRLHGAIFACFANVPFVLNEYHKKCGDFLDTIGYQNNLRLFDSQFDIKEKSIQIIDILHNKDLFTTPLYLDEMKERASYNFKEISII